MDIHSAAAGEADVRRRPLEDLVRSNFPLVGWADGHRPKVGRRVPPGIMRKSGGPRRPRRPTPTKLRSVPGRCRMAPPAIPECREAPARFWSSSVTSCHACQPNNPRFAGKLAYWTHLAVPLVAAWSLAVLWWNSVCRDHQRLVHQKDRAQRAFQMIESRKPPTTSGMVRKMFSSRRNAFRLNLLSYFHRLP